MQHQTILFCQFQTLLFLEFKSIRSIRETPINKESKNTNSNIQKYFKISKISHQNVFIQRINTKSHRHNFKVKTKRVAKLMISPTYLRVAKRNIHTQFILYVFKQYSRLSLIQNSVIQIIPQKFELEKFLKIFLKKKVRILIIQSNFPALGYRIREIFKDISQEKIWNFDNSKQFSGLRISNQRNFQRYFLRKNFEF
eukprot:TRINITY_DN70457_c0_g1_i1.p1 TRINITY_DN70457_c0_g1~~TRINITY_DN70457_c0_g1_i1.p1  ORF type:complete len:197 (+),score=-9.89 TRINITY_DN70457_c0_g1_i1:277-867(+)